MTQKANTVKVSKAEIYKEYGIEYKAGKINSPLFGWINPLLLNGNTKLGKGVWTWSTLAGNYSVTEKINGVDYTTVGTCNCNCVGCYAQRGRYVFHNVRASYVRKTTLARLYMTWVENAITAQIKADKITLCRIHAAGDFFSNEYIEMWKRIIANCPECVFWSYTKNASAENAFNDLPNCNIVKSLIPDVGLNYGHCDYIINLYNALKAAGKPVYICRCGIDPNQHCTNCKGCSKNEYVLFVEHSTGYNAAADPLFPALVEIVNNQPVL